MIFTILAEFAEGVERDTCCQRVPENFKFYSLNETTLEDIFRRQHMPKNLRHVQEGIYVNYEGERQRGV